MLISTLGKLYEKHSLLFPTEIRAQVNAQDLELRDILGQNFSCFRTFRRTSHSRALNKRDKMRKKDIDVVNRWKTVENSKGRKPKMAMKHHYADVQVLLDPFLRYTAAM